MVLLLTWIDIHILNELTDVIDLTKPYTYYYSGTLGIKMY